MNLLLAVITLGVFAAQATAQQKTLRIAVIGGGGAGVTASWLLEQTHNVTLYESSDRFGGDAHTVDVVINNKSYPIDAGFEFLNPREFPHAFRLLELLGVGLNPFQLTSSFTYRSDNSSFVLTPLSDDGISWGSILSPANLANLIRLKAIFDEGQKMVKEDPEGISEQEWITVAEFLTRFKIPKEKIDNFIIPMISSGWGMSSEEFSTWSMENIFRTILTETNGYLAPIFHEIVGGTSAYIRTALQQSSRLRKVLRAQITSVSWEEDLGLYVIRTPEFVEYYDHVIVATPAYAVAKLLANVSIPEVQDVASVISKVDYFKSHLVLHGDVSFMPQDKNSWARVNIRSNTRGTQNGMTMYKPWHSPPETPIFKSWILEGDPMPSPVYAEAHYLHRKLNNDFLAAKKAIREFQGSHHLWFIGSHTLGDRHENAVLSALRVAQKLAWDAPRVIALSNSNPPAQ